MTTFISVIRYTLVLAPSYGVGATAVVNPAAKHPAIHALCAALQIGAVTTPAMHVRKPALQAVVGIYCLDDDDLLSLHNKLTTGM